MISVAVIVLGSVVVAHACGWYLARSLEVEPGYIREVMPTIPVAPLHEGNEAKRWRKSVRRVERRILEEFPEGLTEATAAELAADLSEDRRVVAGALERMREETDCRIKVTRGGEILHDFEADQLAELRSARTRSIPRKLFMFAVAAAANIGAVWPALATFFVAVGSLGAMAYYLNGTTWGLFGIGICLAVFVATVFASLLFHLLLTPLEDGPTLRSSFENASPPDRRNDTDRRASSDQRVGHSSLWVFFDGGGHHHSGGSSSTGSSSNDFEGGGQVIVAIILIAIALAALFLIYVWGRGLWRAITERDAHLDRMSPAFWVRRGEEMDFYEKWIPTNDLVGRLVRSLRRAFSHRRPVDGDLGPRTIARAKRRGGTVSALEIALEEGLDLDEATEVGAELCNLVDGQIVVGDHGGLGFAFPDEVLAEVDETAGEESSIEKDHLWAEYLSFDHGGEQPIRRRVGQENTSVPVNMVGVDWGHIRATDRLVAGTWMMALMGVYLLYWGFSGYLPPLADASPSLAAVGSGLLFAMGLGATCLRSTAHYAARRLAVHGIRRDARRAVFDAIDRTLREGRDQLDVATLTDQLTFTFESAWPDVGRDVFAKEVRGVMVDLEVHYDLEADPAKTGDIIDLSPLRTRWEQVTDGGFETVFGDEIESGEQPDEHEIVFDTEIEHDHVTALQ